MEPQSYATDVFPTERPPPQDPRAYRAVIDWLRAQATGDFQNPVLRGVQRAGQTMPPTLESEVRGGAADTQAGLQATQAGAREYARMPTYPAGYPNVRPLLGGVAQTAGGVGRMAGAGYAMLAKGATELPVTVGEAVTGSPRTRGVEEARSVAEPLVAGTAALGSPGLARSVFHGAARSPHLRNDAGYVHIERDSRGLPTAVRAGPGPPQRALPPGEVEQPPTLNVDVSGAPGGPLYVGYFRGEMESPHAARQNTVGGSRGPGVAAGKQIMDELVNLATEGGYTGVKFSAISSAQTHAAERLLQEAGASRTGMGNEGRLALNETYIGNKAVPGGGGHTIPFPRELPPKPPWYQAEPPMSPSQRRDYERRYGSLPTPEQIAESHATLLEESDFLKAEQARAKAGGVRDRVDVRRSAEAALAARRANQPPPAIVPTRRQPPGPAPSIDQLYEQLMGHPYDPNASGPSLQGQAQDLLHAYRSHYGQNPGSLIDLRDYAIQQGFVPDRATFDRLAGQYGAPSNVTSGAAQGATIPARVEPAPSGLTMGDIEHLPPEAVRSLHDISREFRHHYGYAPQTAAELAEFAAQQGYAGTSQDFLQRFGLGGYTRQGTTEAGLRQGTTPSMPAPPSPARQAAGREAAVARREAQEAARIRGRQFSHVGTPAEQQLLRRVQERQGAGMATEATRAQRRAERASGQQELFRGAEPTRRARAADSIAEPSETQRAGLDPSLGNRAERRAEALRERMIRTNREERGEGGYTEMTDPRVERQSVLDAIESGAGWDAIPPEYLDAYASYHGRTPQTPGDVATFIRDQRAQFQARQQDRAASLNRAEQAGRGENADAVEARHSDLAHLGEAAQDRVHDWARRFRNVEGRYPTRADLAQYFEDQGWTTRHEGE